MTDKIKVVAFDAAFANMGICQAEIDVHTLEITPTMIQLVKTEPDKNKKVVRKSSSDVRRAKELLHAVAQSCAGMNISVAEVPHGSQSASAARGLGIAVCAVASSPVPLLEVTAREVKLAAVGKQTASKSEMIDWAYSLYPHLDWLKHGSSKRENKLTNDNEHLADAVATLHAMVKTEQFQQLIAMAKGGLMKTA